MKLKRIILIILICLLLPLNTFATDFKIGSNRSDQQQYTVYPQDYDETGSAGTIGDPWAGDCIEDAYTACPAGGKIYLRAGYYQLAGTLTITKTLNIIGEGIGNSIILTTDATGIAIGGTADYLTLEGFTIDGTAQPNTPGLRLINVSSGAEYLTFRNIEAKNAGYTAINLFEVNHSLFQNIYAHDNYYTGIHLGSDTAGKNKYNTYRDIYCWNNDFGFDDRGKSIASLEQLNNVYDNIQAWGNTSIGVAIGLQKGGVVSNCLVYENVAGYYGLYLYNVEDFIFTNVIVRNNFTGIRIEDCNRLKFVACQSFDDTVSPAQNYGIELAGTCSEISVIDCKLSPNADGEISGTTAGIVIATDGVMDGTKAVAGDVIYHNGTTWVRLAKGTENYYLKQGASIPAWAAAPAAPSEDDIEAYIFDADAETILGNWDNTANPWADNEVSDTLTSSSCTGLAATATALATARLIGGVSFDGTANIVPTLLSIATALDDHAYVGITDSKAVGENVVFGQLLYFDWTDAEWKLAKANAVGTTPAMRIALETKGNGEACVMLVTGYIRDDSAYEFTAAIGYLSIATGGAVQYAAPSVAGNQVQRVGIGISADIMYFCPSIDVGEI